MNINSRFLKAGFVVVLVASCLVVGSFATRNGLEMIDFIFQKSADTNYSEVQLGKFGDCYEVRNDEFLYLKHSIEINPNNYGKSDSKINEEVLVSIKTHMLRKEFLEKNNIIIDEESIKASADLMRKNLNEIGSEESILFVKDLIESYNVSEDTYWNTIKYYEEERRLVEAYFKEYADIEEQTIIRNEGENINDFIFTNSSIVFEFGE